MRGIEHVSPDASPEEIEAIVLRDGVVVIERLITPEFVDRILDDLMPWIERASANDGDWLGRRTKRLHGLLPKSEAIRENVCNPVILACVDRLLLSWCDKYQLGSCSIAAIGPGEAAQELHRDDLMYPTQHPSERIMHCTTFWALTDFTEANGATRVIPGSHLWDDDREPSPDETVPAEMPKGSVLLYNAATYHGGGANRTEEEWRWALYTSYNLGWLKQEEQQFLVNPPEIARHYSERLQRLVGYQMHTPFLGWYDLQDPIVVLQGYEELSAPKRDDRPEGETRGGRVVLADTVRRA